MRAVGGLDDEHFLHDLLAGLSCSTRRKPTASVRQVLVQSVARIRRQEEPPARRQ
ncbi:hypothetical protein ABXS69_07495 [Actinomyces timonensis]|uniref:Uncharacterized protein n=1 Tax=Actinomyces timonensis TaxID=1288391 RepID=A0AAU8MXX5_9ACTO